MKKSLHLLLVAGVMFMVTTPTITLTKQAESEESSTQERSFKRGQKPKKKNSEPNPNEQMRRSKQQRQKASESPKDKMHKFQKELTEIKKSFKEDGDRAAANKQLDAMPAKIKKISSCMKNSEEHGGMWQTHTHTMERELESVRKFVNTSK